ncbi:MAG TPA: hypothetical protein VGO21_00675 [Candidatus Paceibacterota bacterium]|jgi:hypothetical protein|nr:hypothetical protein [Candidatus Paceibacterota bacterium]
MEQNFQTSFIPKKPMIEHRAAQPRSVGVLTVVSIFILFAVLLSTVGLYFYQGIMKKSLVKMESDLTLAKNRFEPAKIAELKVLDKRLNASNEILSKHIAVTPIFLALQAITMKSVRYTQFNYALGDPAVKDSKISVKMQGIAVGYRSVALQSDLFAKNKNLIDPVFSNLALDDKGNVTFDLNFLVDPTFVDYKLMLSSGDSTTL